jgi:hypothetical protein
MAMQRLMGGGRRQDTDDQMMDENTMGWKWKRGLEAALLLRVYVLGFLDEGVSRSLASVVLRDIGIRSLSLVVQILLTTKGAVQCFDLILVKGQN